MGGDFVPPVDVLIIVDPHSTNIQVKLIQDVRYECSGINPRIQSNV